MTPSQQQLQLIKYLDTLPKNCNRYQMAVNQIANLERLKHRVDPVAKIFHTENLKNRYKYRYKKVFFTDLYDVSKRLEIEINSLKKDIKNGSKVYQVFRV